MQSQANHQKREEPRSVGQLVKGVNEDLLDNHRQLNAYTKASVVATLSGAMAGGSADHFAEQPNALAAGCFVVSTIICIGAAVVAVRSFKKEKRVRQRLLADMQKLKCLSLGGL